MMEVYRLRKAIGARRQMMGETRTPRQSVHDAVNKREAFPLPFDLSGNLAYPRLHKALCSHFGLEPNSNDLLLKSLGACVRWGCPLYVGPPQEVAPNGMFPVDTGIPVTRNIWGVWDIQSYTDHMARPLGDLESVQQIQEYPWPEPDVFDYETLGWETYVGRSFEPIQIWSENRVQYARLVGPPWFPIFSTIMDLVGMEKGLSMMASRPKLIEGLVERIGHFLEAYYERLVASCSGRAEFVRFADDFASQNGILISPSMWRHFFVDLWKRLFAIARKGGLRPWMHSCGAVRPILGDLIDAGLEVFETVQIHAKGMSAHELKREYGAHLTFYGGIDTQHILPFGTPQAVREEVRRVASVLGRNGGYILTSSHTLMDDVPVENAIAMFEEVQSFRP
jgi:uroporphyrinogen decarboxylase